MPFYAMLIHQGKPPALREVVPGKSVTVHCSLLAGYWMDEDSSHWFTMMEHKFDLIGTVGFDFDTMPDRHQTTVRRILAPRAAVIRLEPV